MNLADITTKCYILALIIRDDGERLLLGDGAYEFKDSQQHFIANTYANDVVELQGTDGQMLAGQVRRTATQTFAGYIGDATFSKQKVEEARRDFLMFFRKKHYYTAVYVFSDGTAIQRDRGYIVNAPSVPELYQRFPEWSVGLNFEDPNYYEYAEDDLGQEIAAHKVELELSTAMSGGLIWDGDGAVSDDLSYVGTEIQGEGKNFQLADTGTATLKSAELLGDAEQTTYSGKNLISTRPSSGSANGITWTLNSDGSVKVSGTATANHVISFGSVSMAQGQTYTLSGCPSGGAVGKYMLYTNVVEPQFKDIGSGATDTVIANATAQVNFIVYSGRTINGTIYPMLEIGSSASPYEPYVGGTASPNPDYPQAVNTVTGENTVKITGKNLLGESHDNYGINGNDGTIMQIANRHALVARVQEGQTYTTSRSAVGTSTYLWVAFFAEKPVIGSQSITFADMQPTTLQRTLTAPSGAKYCVIFYGAGTSPDCQLELGSTATAYEPYQGQEFEVNLGKNLLQPMLGLTNNGLTGTVNSDGTITVTGTATNTYAFITDTTTQNIPAGDYIFSDGLDGQTQRCIARFTYADNTSVECDLRNQGAGKTFTLTQTATKCQIRLTNVVSGTSYSLTVKPMVERGSVVTAYAPYFTPIELAKIGNYQDRIYKDDGKWYIEKQVGKVVLDGTENWGTRTGGTAYAYSLSSVFDGQGSYGMSDYFRFIHNGSGSGQTIECLASASTNTNLSLFTNNASLDTVANLKTWLGTHQTSIYYSLATPTTTEITNSELVGQLERLKHAHTYADTTNFSTTAASPNLPAFLKVVAFGDDATPQGGYVWEDGGTGGATIITVDGVDNAQPIWTVVGPATNPSLTNITTGESIQWTGVVPNGQTLVVNMADMTASLSGANVFEFISGSWITLQAGNNRVSYSATAATGIATLEWNGVVG